MDTVVTEVLDQLQAARNEGELRATIESFLKPNDISTYAYIAFLPEQGPMGINNHPQHWLERYAECGYLDIDPVISRARSLSISARESLEAFGWHQGRPPALRSGFYVQGFGLTDLVQSC